jgi:hypothetical protein
MPNQSARLYVVIARETQEETAIDNSQDCIVEVDLERASLSPTPLAVLSPSPPPLTIPSPPAPAIVRKRGRSQTQEAVTPPRRSCHEEFRINDPEPILPCSTAFRSSCFTLFDWRPQASLP